MKMNKVHCLVINQSTVLTTELSRAIGHHRNQSFVEVVDGALHLLKEKLIKHEIGLLFFAKISQPAFASIAKVLRQHSPDTVVVFLTAKNQPISQDILGIEQCDLSLNDASASQLILSNLLHYAQLKQDMRACKHLLSIVDQRNRWLVDTTPEPIAYVYQGVHVHANSAYLALFGFQSMTEMMGTAINDMLPVNNLRVFSRFVSQQKDYLDTRQSLLLTMQRVDKETFRAGLRVAPTVINNTKCLQIWVHPLKLVNHTLQIADVNPRLIVESAEPKNSMYKKGINLSSWRKKVAKKTPHHTITPVAHKQEQPSVNDPNPTRQTITVGTPVVEKNTMKINRAKKGEIGVLKNKLSLKQLIAFAQENKLNQLDIQPLKETKLGKLTHYFVDMPLNKKRVEPVRVQLKKVYGMSAAMFQDYVTITALIGALGKTGKAGERYIVKLDVNNLQDKRFSRWLSIQLQQLPTHTAQIVFLLPYVYCKQNIQQLAGLLYSLKNTAGYIGLSDFTPSTIGMNVIKRFQVKYVAFDVEWLDRIRSNKRQREVLSTLTQKLGRSGIEVIVSPSKAA